MRRSSNQSGFAAVEAILIVVIVAIVGFTGWFVWHSKQAADKALTDATKTSQTGTVKTTPKTVTTFAECKATKGSITQETFPEVCVTQVGKRFTDTATSTQQYLVIKEWGVKLTLSSDIADAYYTGPTTSSDGSAYIGLGTKSLTALNSACAPTATGVANISRESIAAHTQNAAANDGGVDFNNTKLGDYYYGMAGAQAGCSDSDSVNQTQQSQKQAFSKAFLTLVEAN